MFANKTLTNTFKKLLPYLPGALAFAVIAATLTPFTTRLEHMLFDLRTQVKPQLDRADHLVIITIDERDCLETENSVLGVFYDLVERLQELPIAGAGLLIPHQDYDYTRDFPPLPHPRHPAYNKFMIGAYDLFSKVPGNTVLPPALEGDAERIFDAATHREFRQGVVRSLPLFSYLGEKLRPTLALALAQTRNPALKENATAEVTLNYIDPKMFRSVSASDFLSGSPIDLRGKIVIVGSTAFRRRTLNFRDGTFVNTPWQGDNNRISRESSTPLIYVYASLVQNVLTQSHLVPAGMGTRTLQLGLFLATILAAWSYPPAVAIVFFLLAYLFLFFLHCYLFAFTNLYLPLGEATVCGLVFMVICAHYKCKNVYLQRLKDQLDAEAKEDIHRVQSFFLERLADELIARMQKVLFELKNLVCEPSSSAGKILGRISLTCSELIDYLQGMRAFSQVQCETLRSQRVYLRPLVDNICEQFETIVKQRQLEVNCLIKPDLWVQGDRILIENILVNLISNAVKYSHDSGRIEVTAAKTLTSLAIKVKDEGHGIPFELQKKVFDKYYRVKDDAVYRIKGHGLGLYLCRFFAARLGGDITLNSAPGRGSEFTLKLKRRGT